MTAASVDLADACWAELTNASVAFLTAAPAIYNRAIIMNVAKQSKAYINIELQCSHLLSVCTMTV